MSEDSESEASDTEDSPIDDEGKFNYVMVADSRNKKKTKIPQLFKLDNPRQGEPPFMKKRNYPAVLRFHKFRASSEPDDYYFAEALLYTPFRSEEELEKRVEDAAKDGYLQLSEQIIAVKSQVMEHLESTEEARHMVEEAINKSEEIGALMDPEGEQENLDCELEEINLHPDFVHLDPQEFLEVEKSLNREKSYRPIEVEKIELLNK